MNKITRCPGGCGALKEDLYEGFNVVECPSVGCSRFSTKQKRIVDEKYEMLEKAKLEAFNKKKKAQDNQYDIYEFSDSDCDDSINTEYVNQRADIDSYAFDSAYNGTDDDEEEDITKKIRITPTVVVPFYVNDDSERDDS